MTPEQEQIEPETLQADQSRMSDLLAKVSADGHEVLDEVPEVETESTATSEEGQVEPEPEQVEEPTDETNVTGEQNQGEQETESTTDAPLDDYEREIDEKYQAPKGASQRTTEVLKILKRINREEHRKAKTLEKEKQELESRKFLDEQTQKELDDLRNLRSRVAIEQDPQFNEQYVQKIQRHENTALGILRKFDLPEDTAKFIGEQGGLIRFQNSERRMPVGTQNLDGEPFTGTQAEWYDEVMKPMFKSLPPAAQTRLKYELDEALKTAIQRDDALQEARSNPQKFIEQRQQAFQDQVKEFAKRADAQLQKEEDLYGEIAKPKEIPVKATEEEKAAILKHNARLDVAKGSIKQLVGDQSPENLIGMATAKAFQPIAQELIEESNKDRDNWKARALASEARWDKAKNAAQTSRQQGTISQQKPRQENKPYDPAESIKQLMSEVPA